MREKIKTVQAYLQKLNIDGWLLYDFHGSNSLARLFLKKEGMTTRRFFYWIPKQNEPIQIVNAIEPEVLREWPGEKRIYLSWQSLQRELQRLLENQKTIAMEFSPKGEIPYVSKVDGGTLDLIRSFGVEVVSSETFLAHFTAVLSEAQAQSHKRAASLLQQILQESWQWLQKRLEESKEVTEYDLQQKIVEAFHREKLVTDHPPIVAVGLHSADPHYAPTKTETARIQKGDFLLTDLWAKEETPHSIFGDITRVACIGRKPTPKELEVFETVLAAQKTGIELVKRRFAKKIRLEGWEVDDAVRKVIVDKGYGPFFCHRTGHNIEEELHGSGTHLDGFETKDQRPLLLETAFSVEPGIYLQGKFGVRLETDLFVEKDGTVQITGGLQESLYEL